MKQNIFYLNSLSWITCEFLLIYFKSVLFFITITSFFFPSKLKILLSESEHKYLNEGELIAENLLNEYSGVLTSEFN